MSAILQKSVGRVTVLVLCTSPDVGLYLKVSLTVLKLLTGHDFHTKNFKGASFRKKCRRSYDFCSLHLV